MLNTGALKYGTERAVVPGDQSTTIAKGTPMIRYPLYGGVAECAGGADRNRDQRTEHHGRSVHGRDPDAAQHGLSTTYTYGSNANGNFYTISAAADGATVSAP